MLRFRTDLPLDRDTSARFLPWIIGFMVYLAMIAATVALLVDHVTQRWQRDLSGQLTVELPGVMGEDAVERKQRVDAALEEITDTNGIVGTRVLDEAEVKRLLQPWLGDQADQLGVTLPDLVAVSLQPDIRPNLSERRRPPIVPETDWLVRLGRLVGKLMKAPAPLAPVR